jgi:hypothetical protein
MLVLVASRGCKEYKVPQDLRVLEVPPALLGQLGQLGQQDLRA